ncbi:MAG: nucleotidyltransferase family protein [Comamonadaceae bacterium]|nr:MAG: nucleotidyltransferase family protein [Comamonadaceae bacterium]
MTGAQAMILAAGRGERMRPLTDTCPKPLLEVRGKPLIGWHLDALRAAGFTEAVINTAWLGDQIESRYGAASDGVRIRYSHEGTALETAGGILRALPLLDDGFCLMAGDVYMPGFSFSREALARFRAGGMLAHLFLVPNPEHNPKGDFGLADDGRALNQADVRHTYSTCGMFRHALFDGLAPGNPDGLKLSLAPLLRQAMDRGLVTAELYTGAWTDVGTPARLAALNP